MHLIPRDYLIPENMRVIFTLVAKRVGVETELKVKLQVPLALPSIVIVL
jgi:hypothetical protein